jgi:hypothetical protein
MLRIGTGAWQDRSVGEAEIGVMRGPAMKSPTSAPPGSPHTSLSPAPNRINARKRRFGIGRSLNNANRSGVPTVLRRYSANFGHFMSYGRIGLTKLPR